MEEWLKNALGKSLQTYSCAKLLDLVVRKFGQSGVRVTPTLRKRLRRWIDAGAKDEFCVRTSNTQRCLIDVKVTRREWRRLQGRISREFEQHTERGILKTVERFAPRQMRGLKRKWKEQLRKDRKSEAGFRLRLERQWRLPFQLLELQLQCARQYGGALNDTWRQNPKKITASVEVFTRLHARACQIGGEVITLISAGYADGAMARWRSLHEVSIVLQFIAANGEETARRYLEHEAVETWKAAQQYQQHYVRLGAEPFEQTVLDQMRLEYESLVAKYGTKFKEDYGWASKAMNGLRPSFADIEKRTGYEHWRPYYKLASHSVHANPKGALFKLGMLEDTAPLAAGPTNFGFAEPGGETALTLAQATSVLLTCQPSVEHMIVMTMMRQLSQEIGHAFFRVQRRIAEDDATQYPRGGDH